MSIVFNRTITVKLPKGSVGHLRALQTTVEERFSTKENFMNWYDDNNAVKIDRTVSPKFVKAISDGKTLCQFMDVSKVPVQYMVLTDHA